MSTSKRALSTKLDSSDSSKRHKNDVENIEILPNGFEEKEDVEQGGDAPTLHAQLRVITLSSRPSNKLKLKIMLVLLDHYHELRNELANGESFVNSYGYETTLPLHFNWLSYSEVYKELEEASERLRTFKPLRPNSVLPTILGFKAAAGSGGFMACVTSSRQEADAAIASMRELYATFVYSEGNPYYACKKVALEVVEYHPPKFDDSLVFRSLQMLCNDRTGAGIVVFK